jgi:hypothetical protein
VRFLVLLLAGCGRISFDAAGDGPSTDVQLASCTSGAHLPPLAALNTSLSDPADACSVDSILALDGLTAGVDRSTTIAACPDTWDVVNASCGCVAADLGASYLVRTVSMWVAPVTQACGTACTTACGTGHDFSAFVADDIAMPTKIQTVTYDGPALGQIDIDVTRSVRYIMICRQGWGPNRDDFAIDYMEAICQ